MLRGNPAQKKMKLNLSAEIRNLISILSRQLFQGALPINTLNISKNKNA